MDTPIERINKALTQETTGSYTTKSFHHLRDQFRKEMLTLDMSNWTSGKLEYFFQKLHQICVEDQKRIDLKKKNKPTYYKITYRL